MFQIYNREITVLPYLVVPVAVANKEAAFVLGPSRLARQSAEFIDRLYAFIMEKGWGSPVVSQIMPYAKEVLISNTIQTRVPDSDSGRIGLKLTYGALVSKETFLHYEGVCSKVFGYLDDYFLCEFGHVMSMKSASTIVEQFQQKARQVEELVTEEKTNDLLTKLEHSFFLDADSAGSVMRKLKLIRNWRKGPSVTRRAPMPKLEHSKLFWRSVDQSLRRNDSDSRQAIKDLADMAKLRRVSCTTDLARIYLEAGLKEDLEKLSEARFIEIAAKVLKEDDSLSEEQQTKLISKIQIGLRID
jgi:hypothetical protein